MLSATDIDAFASSVRGALRVHWPSATRAGTAEAERMDKAWDTAAEYAWFDLGAAGELGAAVAACRETGRLACPLPVFDAFVAGRLFGAEAPVVMAMSSGEVRLMAVVAGTVTPRASSRQRPARRTSWSCLSARERQSCERFATGHRQGVSPVRPGRTSRWAMSWPASR
jgi:hypothetical protein